MKRPSVPLLLLTAALVLSALSAYAQPVLSAKSGMVAKVEGQVYLNDNLLEDSATHFPDIKENQVVRTQDGRAEVLLTPGVFLRIGENTSFKMISTRLIDTRLELLTGSAVVEAAEIGKDNKVTVACKDGTVALTKAGVYRFDTEPARIKVFRGSAEVEIAGQTIAVSSGKMLTLSGAVASTEKFDTEDSDSLDNWSRRRGAYVAMANVSAAKSLLSTGGYSRSGLGWGVNNGPCTGAWGFNQWYGMMTYIPCSGTFNSPYGFRYWSPFTVMRAYYVPPPMPSGGFGNGGGAFPSNVGYAGVANTSTGYSGVAASAPSMSSSSMGSSSPAASSSGGGASAAASSSAGHGAASGGHH